MHILDVDGGGGNDDFGSDKEPLRELMKASEGGQEQEDTEI